MCSRHRFQPVRVPAAVPPRSPARSMCWAGSRRLPTPTERMAARMAAVETAACYGKPAKAGWGGRPTCFNTFCVAGTGFNRCGFRRPYRRGHRQDRCAGLAAAGCQRRRSVWQREWQRLKPPPVMENRLKPVGSAGQRVLTRFVWQAPVSTGALAGALLGSRGPTGCHSWRCGDRRR